MDEQNNRELVSQMRDMAYQRAITLHRMADTQDPFARDDEYMYFGEIARKFITARESLLGNIKEDSTERKLWEEAKPSIKEGDRVQGEISDLILEENIAEARRRMFSDLDVSQKKVIKKLRAIYDYMGEDILEDIVEAEEATTKTFMLVSFLGSATVLFLFFTIYVIHRTGKTEDALLKQGHRIRSLYEVTAMTGITEDERLNKMLELGCDFLGTDLGKLCKVDLNENQSLVMNYFSRENRGNLFSGKKIPLNSTFSSVVFSSNAPLAIDHIKNSDLNQLECYKASNMEAYIATPIYVYGEKFGTISFASLKPKLHGFTDTDKDLVSLIGSWISVTLEHKFAHEQAIEAKLTAEDANNAKSIFLAKMSHELRTPLNAIIGYSDLLHEEISDTNREHAQDLENIKSSGTHLLGLINDVLDISKIEVGRMDLVLDDVEVSTMVDVVNTVAHPLVSRNNNKFKCNVASNVNMVKADRIKLKQVILNMISNAGKFTKNGEIRLEVTRINENGDEWVIFSVVDTGIGISTEMQESIFEAFTQVETRGTNNSEGTGLGLAISRQLCRLMGGDITVSSTLGRGSVFSIALPSADKMSASEDDDDNEVGNLLQFRKN